MTNHNIIKTLLPVNQNRESHENPEGSTPMDPDFDLLPLPDQEAVNYRAEIPEDNRLQNVQAISANIRRMKKQSRPLSSNNIGSLARRLF